MLVYKATNKKNGKMYIGKTIREMSHAKARHHDRSKLGFDTYFYNSIRKNGIDAFTWEVIYNGTSDEDICEKEIFYIKQLNTRDKSVGYNMTDGGDGSAGIIIKGSTRELLSQCNSGENNNCYGLYGENHPAFGNKHTDETKERISKAHRGKPKSSSAKQKLSEARLALSPYTYEIRLQAVKLREQGLTYQKIADTLGMPHSATVTKIVQNFKRQYATVQTTSE